MTANRLDTLKSIIDRLCQSRVFHLVLLLTLSSSIIFYNLGQNSLHDRDEAWYALVSQNILDTNDWVTLHYDGAPWFEKAPLQFWLTATLFELFGVSEFTVRFWSASFSVASILILYLLARTIFSVQIALLASLILLTTTQFLYYHGAKTGELDTAVVFFMTGSLLCFFLGLHDKKYFFLACLSIGLCAMSKHLTYLLPTVLIIGVFILATKSWRTISLRTWSLGLTIIGLTVLPWHLAQWILYGDSFTQVYFFREVYDPAVSSGEHPLGYLFYLVTIKDGFFPWSILVPASVGWIFSRQSKNYLPANVLLIVWISGVLSIITLSEVKLFWYVLPAYPPLAILVAQLLLSFLRNRDSRILDISVLVSFGLVLSLTVNEGNPFGHLASQSMTRVHFLDELQSGYQSQGAPFVLVLASIGTLILVLWLLVARRARIHSGLRWVRFLIVACLFGTAFHRITMPLRFSKHRSAFHQVCQEVSKRRDTHRTLLIALPRRKIRAPAHIFYIKQIQPPPRVVTTPRKLIARRRVKPSRLILFDRDLFRRIGRAHPPYWFRDLRVLFENEDYILFEVVASSD